MGCPSSGQILGASVLPVTVCVAIFLTIQPDRVIQPPRRPQPIALAIEWVAKITTVALEMVLPAIAGGYLDRRLGSRYWVFVGLAVGMATGMYHLLQMTRKPNGQDNKPNGQDKRTSSDAGEGQGR